jgi:hypothetical protein
MGLDTIAVMLIVQLLEASEFIRKNGGLIFFSALFLILWLSGVITIVRRAER